MPNFNAGDIKAITCNHPDLGSFNFVTKSNEDYTVDFGGFITEDDSNAVTGSGEYINKTNRKAWSFEGILMTDFLSENETVNISDLVESPKLATWTFSHASGAIWRGKGKPVGDITVATNTAQMSVKIQGGGKLLKL